PQETIGTSSVVSSPQAGHDTTAGTLSTSRTLPSRSVPAQSISQLKVRASGTTWRRCPIRTSTRVTGRPPACRFTAPAMASHSDSSCTAASLGLAVVHFVALARHTVVEAGSAVDLVDVVVVAADDDVVAVAADEHVLGCPAGQRVVPAVTAHGVVARPAVEVVVAAVAPDRVIARLAADDVVATLAVDGVVTVAADDDVVLVRAVDEGRPLLARGVEPGVGGLLPIAQHLDGMRRPPAGEGRPDQKDGDRQPPGRPAATCPLADLSHRSPAPCLPGAHRRNGNRRLSPVAPQGIGNIPEIFGVPALALILSESSALAGFLSSRDGPRA